MYAPDARYRSLAADDSKMRARASCAPIADAPVMSTAAIHCPPAVLFDMVALNRMRAAVPVAKEKSGPTVAKSVKDVDVVVSEAVTCSVRLPRSVIVFSPVEMMSPLLAVAFAGAVSRRLSRTSYVGIHLRSRNDFSGDPRTRRCPRHSNHPPSALRTLASHVRQLARPTLPAGVIGTVDYIDVLRC